MLTTPEIPLDYLKVPTNQRVVHSKPRRTSSFIVKSNQFDERFASNLSLPSAGNSILNGPNPSRQPQSISSHLSVHSALRTNENENEDEDKIEFIPSLIVPTIELSPLRENTKTNNHHFLKVPKNYRLHELLQESGWSNPLLHGRYEKKIYQYRLFLYDYLLQPNRIR